MNILNEEVDGDPGYSLEIELSPAERSVLEDSIRYQYIQNIRAASPQHSKWFEENPISEYHLGCHRLEHEKIWSKRSRIFNRHTVESIKSLGFMQRLTKAFGDFEISGESGIEREEIYWRLVRPNMAADVGPVHADQWFWMLGNGHTPQGVERVKVWIAVVTEPGRNGLQVVPGSHRAQWRWHGEMRDGMMKPVFDEDPAMIGLTLPDFAPGQAIVFNDRLLHAGAINQGRFTRFSVEFTLFTRPGAVRNGVH